jgi:hypothetical protein
VQVGGSCRPGSTIVGWPATRTADSINRPAAIAFDTEATDTPLHRA